MPRVSPDKLAPTTTVGLFDDSVDSITFSDIHNLFFASPSPLVLSLP